MVNQVPREILPGNLLCGARFNIQASRCWTKDEAKERQRLILGKNGVRARVKHFHDHGYGSAGPTSNANSAGKVLGGREGEDGGDFAGYFKSLPNGASHAITFSPSLARDAGHKAKLKAYLRAYAENGGTALQINMVAPEMLRDAQKHPENYRRLLVRVTGYNAYFTAICRKLQDELIARLSHEL
jgi:hypothetical protein